MGDEVERVPFKLTVRVELNLGHAEYNELDMVSVGDRRVPRRISVHFPGTAATEKSSPGQPALDMQIEVIKGIPMCSSLTLTKTPHGHEVRSKDLRLIRIEDWIEYIVARCSHQYTLSGNDVRVALSGSGPTVEDIRNVTEARKPLRNVGGRHRRTIDREFLTKVAGIYREQIDDRPLKAIEFAFDVQPRTAAWYVELCRSDEYRLLPKADSKGKKKA